MNTDEFLRAVNAISTTLGKRFVVCVSVDRMEDLQDLATYLNPTWDSNVDNTAERLYIGTMLGTHLIYTPGHLMARKPSMYAEFGNHFVNFSDPVVHSTLWRAESIFHPTT